MQPIALSSHLTVAHTYITMSKITTTNKDICIAPFLLSWVLFPWVLQQTPLPESFCYMIHLLHVSNMTATPHSSIWLNQRLWENIERSDTDSSLNDAKWSAMHSLCHWGRVCPLQFWKFRVTVESKWCHVVMVEAAESLWVCLTSILDI